MDGHEVDGVERLDDGVRLVSRSERIDVVGDTRQRGIAAILNATDEPAHFFQILPGLLPSWAAQLECIRGCREHMFDEIRRRNAVHAHDPLPHVRSHVFKDPLILDIQLGEQTGGCGISQGRGQRGSQPCEGRVGQAHESRSKERGRTQVGGWLGQVSNQCRDVLNLIRVKEPESLVDVRRDRPLFERVLELTMARARSKQNGDVAGTRRPHDAGLAISNVVLAEYPDDLLRDGRGTLFRFVRHRDPQRRSSPVRSRIDGESIRLAVREVVGPRFWPRDFPEQIIDERQEFRERAEAARNRPSGIPAGPDPFDVPARFLQHGDFRVAEPVDRLLPIADDEDGRVGGQPEPFSPRLNQERHQLPLGTARILEFVDEHVVIPRFEAEAALRKFIHLPEQRQRALEHVGEVQD